ncbi:hypothetical protein EDB89DRAFT_1905152 [Lactarius sanguifluus]|nr:hypothetical protein EDB89DRAFT_1905152 [Lactarius sanguifluus]
MAPGSIEDLQHYTGLVPAIGGLSAHIKANSLLSDLPELDFPPSPALLAPSFPPFMPYVKTFEVDPENLWPGVTQDDARPLDPALTDTRRRAATSMCYALSRRRSTRSAPSGTIFSPAGFSPDIAFHERTAEAARHFLSTDRTDSLARIWHTALNVLTLLRELEESARDPLSDDAYDAGSDHSLQGRVASPAVLSDVPTDALDEEEDEFDVDEESKRWEERLVLCSDRLYKQDFEKQRGVVAGYLDTVDEVLFGGRKSVEVREGVSGQGPTLDRAATRSRPGGAQH